MLHRDAEAMWAGLALLF